MASKQYLIENGKVDISETWLWEKYPAAFAMLLYDHTTKENIYWATDSYEAFGEGYRFHDAIVPESIVDDKGDIIQPRAMKSREEQIRRSKDKGEVFTPTWVCNAQNNLVDNEWFGRPGVFNVESGDTRSWEPTLSPIEFPDDKERNWKAYVKSPRLEITCGEAPYLASRYDTTTGEYIPVERRIGLLDRKLRVICENVHTPKEWREWARIALQNIYGYEWQGDSLLIARESLLATVFEFYYYKFQKQYPWQGVKGLAYVISWNIWQMDGLKYGLPGYEPSERYDEVESGVLSLFDDEPSPEDTHPRERLCRYKDWALEDELQRNRKNPECMRQLKEEKFKIIFKSLLD